MADELMMRGGWVRLDDPLATLPATPRRLLAGAQRILDRDGFPGLSLQNIADEAGEHKSLINYHFGGKDGLVALLIDSIWHDADVELVRHMRKRRPNDALEFESLLEAQRGLAQDATAYRRFFDLLPYAIRDRALRKQLVRLYDWYRGIGQMYLGGADAAQTQVLPLATLQLAIAQGIAMQHCIAPAAGICDRAFMLWREMLGAWFGVLSTTDTPGLQNFATRSVENPAQPPGRLDDPVAPLPPVGRQLLAAAQRVLRRKGLGGLTLDGVAAVSKEPRSAVWYYFGDKATLVRTLLEAHVYSMQSSMERNLQAGEKTSSVADFVEVVWLGRTNPSSDEVMFFELLPPGLHDETLNSLVARLQASLRDSLAAGLLERMNGGAAGRAQDLAALCVAVRYGLSIQALLDSSIEASPAAQAWRSILENWCSKSVDAAPILNTLRRSKTEHS